MATQNQIMRIIDIGRFLKLYFIIIFIYGRVNCEPYLSDGNIKCNAKYGRCPEEWPCCSPYGECGSGPTCVGGCNPQFSLTDQSCLPNPVLVPFNTLSFTSEDKATMRIESSNVHKADPILRTESRLKDKEYELKKHKIIHFTNYLVTADEKEAQKMLMDYNFVHSGMTQIDSNTGDIQLIMPKRSTGSLIATTRSFLYGKISVTMRTARSGGVITALVLMSAVGDELDFEFVGSELNHVQTNHYYQGELDFTKMKKHHIDQDTWGNYHTYEVSWSEEKVEWVVDGQVIRSLYKKDTWDSKLNLYKYPESPMRLEIAIWPGGSEKNEIGTIQWAGGLVDWENSPDMLEKGYFAVNIRDIQIAPSANRHLPKIYHCLAVKSGKDINELQPEDLNKVYFAYNGTRDASYNENSLEWNCLDDLYVPGINSSGIDFMKLREKSLISPANGRAARQSQENTLGDEIDVEEWYRRCMQYKPKRESSGCRSSYSSSRKFLITLIIVFAIII